MTGCERPIVIRAWRISCQWSRVSSSFSFSKYCLEYHIVDKVFTKDNLQAPLHGFHKSFPDSGHVWCTWRVEQPLTALLLQLSSHFLFVNLFNSLFNFPISPNEVSSIVGAKLLQMSPSIEKSHQNQDEVICFQGPGNFKMDGSRIHTYKDGSPSLPYNLSPSSLHAKRAKIVNSWIRKRWLVGGQPNLR